MKPFQQKKMQTQSPTSLVKALWGDGGIVFRAHLIEATPTLI
jgi:hypothetical protein